MTLTPDTRILPVIWSGIPAELRDERRWAIWKAEPDAAGRLTKVPYRASASKFKASATDPDTWGTFEQAKAAYEHQEGDGVLFALGGGVSGVDFDGVRDLETGAITPEALTEIEELASYSEITPSGEGVHVLLRGVLPDGRSGAKQGGVEVYSDARFFTMTGWRLPDAGGLVEERQGELEAFSRRHFPAKAPAQQEARPSRPAAPVTLDDEELIARASAADDGGKFARLWAGDATGYPSASEAVAALLCKLAFWTGKDKARMDHLFRGSALISEKWDSPRGETTWGDLEIERAMAITTETYSVGTDMSKQRKHRLHVVRTHGAGEGSGAAPLDVGHVAVADEGDGGDEDGEFGESGSGDEEEVEEQQEAQQSSEQEAPAVQGTTPLVKREIKVNYVPLRQPVLATLDALRTINRNRAVPLIFVRGNRLTRVLLDEQGETLISELDEAAATWLATGSADFVKLTKEGYVQVFPPPAVVKTLLGMGHYAEIPPLRGTVAIPTLRPDGTVLDRPGYDAATQLIYVPQPGFEMPELPEHPTALEVSSAADYIQQEVFIDFPFTDEASRANAWALLLTPIIRPAIAGCVPLCLLDAPTMGTGKTKLANTVTLIATGKYAGAMVEPSGNEDDWRKSILAVLLSGRPVVLIDNVARELRSPSLAAALTTTMYEGRQLQYTKWLRLPQRATWMATGNNIKVAGDLPRRCYIARLNAKTAAPWERTGFHHPELEEWVLEHRADLVAALLTIVRGWVVAGRPLPANQPSMGGYEEWVKMESGILAYAGVGGFLANRREMFERAAEESHQWQGFLEALGEMWSDPEKPFTVAEVVWQLEQERDKFVDEQRLLVALPASLAVAIAGKEPGFPHKLGKAFAQHEEQRFGSYGLRLERAPGERHHATLWHVISGD